MEETIPWVGNFYKLVNLCKEHHWKNFPLKYGFFVRRKSASVEETIKWVGNFVNLCKKHHWKNFPQKYGFFVRRKSASAHCQAKIVSWHKFTQACKNVIISSTDADFLKSHILSIVQLLHYQAKIVSLHKLVKISSQWDYLAIDTLPAIWLQRYTPFSKKAFAGGPVDSIFCLVTSNSHAQWETQRN